MIRATELQSRRGQRSEVSQEPVGSSPCDMPRSPIDRSPELPPVLTVVTSSCLWLRSPFDCCLEQLMYECLVRLALPRCQLSEFG